MRRPSPSVFRRWAIWPSWTRGVVRRPGRLTPRGYATVTSLERYPDAGHEIHGFTLQRKKHVPELQLTALHLQHNGTGAEYVHVAREDKNNVFSIGFKTNPPDATGVPHILEHTTLCGSERYPVRDPFFKMLRRSLSNFMNAFTSSDHTSYPFATTNAQDFNNLLSVYLDATLHPLLREHDFLQEGWRIGPVDPHKVVATAPGLANKDLVFKGVVYNEMKGQMADASYLYYTRFQDHIFPAINNAGGDPERMTDLSYAELVKFHRDHYHPSNAKIFTYGDMPLASHTLGLDRHLSSFSKQSIDTSIKLPINLQDGPLYHTVKGPVDAMLDPTVQHKTSTSWLLGDTSDVLETFSLGVLTSLLTGGYGSPLYQSLIHSGLGLDFSPNTGFDGSSKIGIFSVGLNGVREEDVPRVKATIQQTLMEVHSKGFDKAKIDGILHQLELSLKHKTANFGMAVMQRLESGWFNGNDPFDALVWNDLVRAFKKKLSKGDYLECLLQKYLLNERTMTFTTEPSASFGQEMAAAESARLDSMVSHAAKAAGGIDAATDEYVKREIELLGEQVKAPDQDLSSLPTLRVKDISREMERKHTRDSALRSVKVQWREAPTNGLTYFRAVHRLDGLPKELRMLLPLFTDSILRLGTENQSMEELEDLIKLKTGGINLGYYSSPSPNDMSSAVEGLSFSGHALDKNVPSMYELLRVLLQETDFESPEASNNIMQLIQTEASCASDAIANAGHSYARRYAEAGLTPHGLLNEQIGGLTQVQQILDISSRHPSEALEDIMPKLKAIQKFAISNSASLRAAITCGPESSAANEASLSEFLKSLPETYSMPSLLTTSNSEIYTPKTFFPLPYQVSYAAAALPTVPYAETAGASLQVISQLLTHRHLHHEIREKGGAYGGGAYARGLSGMFGFYSYRDPNPQNTLEIIRNAGRFARDKPWTSQDLEEAKLSTFQSVDAPQSVSDEGMTRFLSGVDEAMEQKRREQLLDVNKDDIRDIAQKYLVDGKKNIRIAVLGEEKVWVKPSDGWTVKKIGLGKPDEVDAQSE